MARTGQHPDWISVIRRCEFMGVLALGLCLSADIGTSRAQAQTYTVLHQFTGADGWGPIDLIRDLAGNLYGTTTTGTGAAAHGTVFKLDSAGRFAMLHAFSLQEGNLPWGLIRDSAGNLYGVTDSGGGPSNCGTLFKLDPSAKLTVLHRFRGGDDCGPNAGLVRDRAGNLYGTTRGTVGPGSITSPGIIFKVDPTGRETGLFSLSTALGIITSGLIVDEAGNAYFATNLAGSGDVLKLDPSGNLTVLWGTAGLPNQGIPNNGLIRDFAGNLYGTTNGGGINNPACFFSSLNTSCGVVFRVDPTGGGTVLYSFPGGADGGVLYSGLVRDFAGNLYGAADRGGINNPACFLGSCGVVFKLDPSDRETVLYSFTGGADGENPVGGLVLDLAGNLYGTAQGPNNPACGQFGCGVVFKLKP